MDTPAFLSLNGEWQFTLDDTRTLMPVPSAWEAHIADHDSDGPAIYRRNFCLPIGWLTHGGDIWLEAQAISFAATIFINGQLAGEHVGLWSAFALKITPLLRLGSNHIRINVWKPGQRYPVRECLAGFLPDVYKPFGGIWQPIGLRLGDVASPSPPTAPHTWRTRRDQVLLNGQPIHLRGVLDWGWNADRLTPIRSADEVREMIGKARALGFNLIKACLYVPDATFFEVCEAEGMWVWLELPLWQPQVTPAFRALARRETRAILQRVQRHNCIAILSLGCELDTQVDATLLRDLRRLARKYLPQVLHCDNSGSSEAYGGITAASGAFYDYHFYTDLHYFEALIDHFDRRYQAIKPWIYGEFCDADTLRYPPSANHPQATVVRKFILEQTRKRHASGGYVLTGWQDTPITISGVVDDAGDLKFDPAEWQGFNADRVLLIDRLRARRWQHGGDRPAHLDPFVFWHDEPLQYALLLSNGGAALGRGRLGWRLTDVASGALLSVGEQSSPKIAAGTVMQIGLMAAEIASQPIAHMQTLQLDVWLEAGDNRVTNMWQLWRVPRQTQTPNFDTQLTPALLAAVAAGQNSVCWLSAPDPRFTAQLPFWREAIHYFAPHAVWDGVPHAGYCDLRFYSIASDYAIHLAKLSATLTQLCPTQPATVRPIWRRFDARAQHWHEYLVEVHIGRGRLFISTLRFAGGLGYQPATLDDNPMGAWLLARLVDLGADAALLS